jgi:hypothetical protein
MGSKFTKLGAALIVLSATACKSMQPVTNLDDFLSQKNPSFIVVTTPEHSTREEALVFKGPRIEGSSLSGVVFNEATTVPVTQVRTIMAPQFDRKKTTIAALLGAAVGGTVFYVMSLKGDGHASAYDNPGCGHQTSCYVPPNTIP